MKSLKPEWTEGMQWFVEMTTTYQDIQPAIAGTPSHPPDTGLRQSKSVWKFAVEKITKQEYVIEVRRQDPEPSPGYFLLHFRKEPLTLSKIVVIDGHGKCRVVLTTPAESCYIYDDIFGLIWDFPRFPPMTANDGRDFFTPDGTKVRERVKILENDKILFEWTVEYLLDTRSASQIWERGKPWWSAAKRCSVARGFESPEPWIYASGRLIRFCNK